MIVTGPVHDRPVIRRVVGGGAAVLLVVAVLVAARPARVWALLKTTDSNWLAAAAAVAGCVLILRALRLALLLPPGRLRLMTAIPLAAAAQAAALFVPWRAGELALPLLLRRSCGWDLASGTGTLLASRGLDLATLGAWAAAGAVLVWGSDAPAALGLAGIMMLAPFALPAAAAAADRCSIQFLAVRGQRGRRWARRIRRLSRAVAAIAARPGRLAAAAVASLAMWGGVWGSTWLLLAAMGFRWPAANVVAGSAVASLANLVPVNLIANLGTLEAGWTAAFVALGVPLADAAATGLATHLWALVLHVIFGILGWLLLNRTANP